MRFSSAALLLGLSASAAINSVVAAPTAYAASGAVALLKRQDSDNSTDTGSDDTGSLFINETSQDQLVVLIQQLSEDLGQVNKMLSTVTELFSVVGTTTGLIIGTPTTELNTTTFLNINETLGAFFEELVDATNDLIANSTTMLNDIQNIGQELQALDLATTAPPGFFDDDDDDDDGDDDGDDGDDEDGDDQDDGDDDEGNDDDDD